MLLQFSTFHDIKLITWKTLMVIKKKRLLCQFSFLRYRTLLMFWINR